MKNAFMLTGIILIYIIIPVLSLETNFNEIKKHYEIITDNIRYDPNANSIKSISDIQTNQQIAIIPLNRVMSSSEPYQFEEFFNRNHKEKLIGRLLIEKFIGVNSTYYHFIKSLPSSEDLTDYNHFTESQIKEFNNRIFINNNNYTKQNQQLKNEYQQILQKIPSNPMTSALLTFELFNWANSIVTMYGMKFRKYLYYKDVKRIQTYFQDIGNNEEICLVPGLNMFNKGTFSNSLGNNFFSNVYIYKSNIYLNSDRFIEEGKEVYNEISFESNRFLFEQSGIFIEGNFHEDVSIKITPGLWNLNKLNLCKELSCLDSIHNNIQGISISDVEFVFKHNFNSQFLLFCQIDQLDDDKDDLKNAYRMLKNNKQVSKHNYVKAIARALDLIKKYVKRQNKTKLINDIKEYETYSNTFSKDKKILNILRYSISQKKILFKQMNMLTDKFIVEMKNDVFNSIKNFYI